MDTDAIIARKPDGRPDRRAGAHQRARLARAKRWEDVEAIRDAGIHVVTTLNVQHLESVADAVATITGAPVNERLPDEVLETADEIELVDMSPHALRQRMRHGNVYPPERTQVALERFFTEANLTALRELALRSTARRVEGQLEDTASGAALQLVADRVLVLVDGGPASARATRTGAGLAGALHAALVAVVIETPEAAHRPFDRTRDLQEAIDDAVDLGAQVARFEAKDLPTGLQDAVRARRATHLVLPHAEVEGLRRLFSARSRTRSSPCSRSSRSISSHPAEGVRDGRRGRSAADDLPRASSRRLEPR